MKPREQYYIRDHKTGRYYEVIPEKFEDNRLYRRLNNGRYEPVSMLHDMDLPEGVWVVKRKRGSTGMTNSDFLRWQYQLEHIADLENPLLQLTTAKLGYVDKVLEEVMYSDRYEGRAWQDRFKLQVAEVIYKLTGKKI